MHIWSVDIVHTVDIIHVIHFLHNMFLCSAQVFEGHPFIVEAGVSVGGKDVKQVSCAEVFVFSHMLWSLEKHAISFLLRFIYLTIYLTNS